MALRSGAGTGVIVSLVVFIITTVFLLVLTIVFYGGLNNEKATRASAENDLKVYVTDSERNSDKFKQVEANAKSQGNLSVVRYLTRQMEETMQYVDGNPNTTLEVFQQNMARSVGENGVVKTYLSDLQRTLSTRETELDNANQQLQSQSNALAEKDTLMEDMRRQQQDEIDEVMQRIDALSQAAEDYRSRVDNLAQQLEQSRQDLRDQYEGEVSDLESEIENYSQDNAVLKSRLNELESKLDAERIKPHDPATLVDGLVIDTLRSADQIFIDRGRSNHIVRGMTFEVYDDPSSIRVNPRTGQLPRGKASMEVIEVQDISATCKITRSVPGRPVVRGDVIVNAVYDPDYVFKFLVHGKFDVDKDGRPTENEAEYLRTLVTDWGGEVVISDELPGDLDFLILGVEPPKPIDPPINAPDHVFDDWLRKNLAHEKYNQLKRQAQDAQIPSLSANRFLILIGHTER
ncbi:MAG: hypothetical protein O7G85_10560 [Planctomycetota bacterium]|nr:hypothetical protein [Planctomycetota bacterium]